MSPVDRIRPNAPTLNNQEVTGGAPGLAARQEIARGPGFASSSQFERPTVESPRLTGLSRIEQMRANAETAAIGRLPPAQREQYLSVHAALADDPKAQSSLRNLLFSGQLRYSEARDGSGNLLTQLNKLADPTTQTIEGVDRQQLLGQIVKDVARPFSIDQGQGNYFCGATAALTGLALRNPAEYARVATGLGTDGQVDLVSRHRRNADDGSFRRGQIISLEVQPEALQDPNRSVTQRLMAPALTEYGNGEHYKTRADGVNVRQGRGPHGNGPPGLQHAPGQLKGTVSDQVADMQEAVQGGDFEAVRLDGAPPAEKEKIKSNALQLMQEQVGSGVNVAMKIDGHWVTVTAVNDQSITYADNQGRISTGNAQELIDKADAITYDKTKAQPPPALLEVSINVALPEDPGGGTSGNTGTIDPDDWNTN